MTPTNEDLLALADRLDEGRSHCGHCGAEAVEQNSRGQYICVACLRENLVRAAHSLRYEAAAALRAIVAEREALRAALESIAKNTCCEGCQEAALVARQALKGLTND